MSKKQTTLNGCLGDRVGKRTVNQDECDYELSSKHPRVIFEESNYDVYENESETHLYIFSDSDMI